MVSFAHLNGNKGRELAGNSAQSSIVTWYLLKNQGDQIQFVSDTNEDWPFGTGTRDKAFSYPDKTEGLVAELIAQGILEDNGFLYIDDEEPNSVYVRDIRNVWSNKT